MELTALLDPSFQAFGQTILNTGILGVREWTRLACISQDMRYCVNHIFSLLTLDQILLLLMAFPDMPTVLTRRHDVPQHVLVWARDWDGAHCSRRLVRIGYHLETDHLDPCQTLVATIPSHYKHSFCMNHSLAYCPILNNGLEIAVARLALQDANERMPKRRRLE